MHIISIKIPPYIAIAVVFLFALVVGGGVWVLSNQEVSVPGGVLVPTKQLQEESDETANWETLTADKGATFRYPENLSTNYIRPQEWPPELLIIDDAVFSCEEGGLGIDGRPGMTIQKEINNTVYCIENVSEGAAGTFYTDYTYTFLKDSKLAKFSFTLAYPQCENYDDPQKTECEQERQTFDLDVLISRIAGSAQL